jgi:hypothetical protein
MLVTLALSCAPAVAHENHALVVITGTVISADARRIQIDSFDGANFTRTQLSVTLDSNTRYRIGKARVDGLELRAGERVELIVQSKDTPDGSLQFKAIQVRIDAPKAR